MAFCMLTRSCECVNTRDSTKQSLGRSIKMVGVKGFEPSTSSSRTKRAAKLRCTPIEWPIDSTLFLLLANVGLFCFFLFANSRFRIHYHYSMDRWMKQNFYRQQSQAGVTIIEMLIVVAVIGVLSGIVVPSLTGFLSTSERNAIASDKGSLQSALDGYRSANANKIPILIETGETTTTEATRITACFRTSAGGLRVTPPKNNCFIDLAALAKGGFSTVRFIRRLGIQR